MIKISEKNVIFLLREIQCVFYIEYNGKKMNKNTRKTGRNIWHRICRKIRAVFNIVFVWRPADTGILLPYYDAEKQSNTTFADLFRYRNDVWYLCKTNLGKCPLLLFGHGGSSGMIHKT